MRCAWLALAAMLMSALAPAVSQAIAATAPVAPAALLGEICSIDGQRGPPSARDEGGAGSAPVPHAHEKCPYCSLHGGPGVPPAAVVPSIAPRAAQTHWFAPSRPIACAAAWPAAQSRAPPSRA